MEFEDEVDLLMSSDIIVAQLVTKDVQFTRSQSGWIFREDKRELVGPFNSDIYSVQGISLDTRKRREHLSEEDLQKNKELNIESLTKSSPSSFELASEVQYLTKTLFKRVEMFLLKRFSTDSREQYAFSYLLIAFKCLQGSV